LFPFLGQSQNWGDQEFYLIDSLNLNQLSDDDKELIDTSLVIYHSTMVDTIELAMLENIVDNCWNEEVWPKYNELLIKKVKIELVLTEEEEELRALVYFLAGGISNRGFYYDQHGDLISALKNYHESLSLYERIENKNGTATTLNNLGVIYSVIGDTSKALEYHRQSLETKLELKEPAGVALSYNNIGTIYENSGLPFRALEYYEKSLKISTDISDTRGMAMTYDNLGDIYFKEAVYGKAFSYYTLGLESWEKSGIAIGISTGKNNLANVLIQMNKWEQAKIFALESFEIANELNYPGDLENCAKTLVEIYQHESDFEKAFFYSSLYIKMKEKVKSEENVNEAYKKSMQYEYQKESLKDSLEFQKEREVNSVQLKQQETQAYALWGGVALLSILFLVGLRSFLRKKKDNELIHQQKIEVETKNEEIERQHQALANTHQEISDSITYAKRIQNAILPTDEKLKSQLNESFVLFLPKDVVSGDFYWIQEVNGELLVAVADCTGHGVPGAMVSIVCHNALDRVVGEFGISEPGKILDRTRDIIIETFESKSDFVRDGMDISIAKINFDNNQIEWAGANNPLYLISEHELKIISPNKQPVGKFDKSESFQSHLIDVNEGDLIYLFTDGYMDQFGGEKGKKYKYSKFRDFLIQIHEQPLENQKEELLTEFVNWKGSQEQVDDICIIGIKM
jgi:serine phosphatase RsbU (regulator of sigma subunit)